jgi:nucleotide-binding universal stress UspA family protein
MKVLVAVDGSSGSFEAVNQIGKLLSAGADEVALFYTPPNVRVSQTTDADLQARTREALAQVIFDEARKRLPVALQSAAQTIVGTQDPRVGVVQAAEKWGAELVAVGARGLGLLDRLLLGSVSRAVVNASKVPVWVARTSTLPPHPTMNLLVACESPELGRSGAELLGRLSWPAGVACRTVTVVSPMFVGRVPEWVQRQARSPEVEAMVQNWAREHEEEVRANVERMQQFCRELPPPCRDCQTLVVEGEPATEILAAIAREKIDLVVLGIKRKRAFAQAILGSTSEAVLNHAPCSVLLVPQP